MNGPLQALDADYFHIKSDILARTMSFSTQPGSMAGLVTLSVGRVKEIMRLNAEGKKPEKITSDTVVDMTSEEPTYINVIGEDSITRFDKSKKKKRKKSKGSQGGGQNNQPHKEGGESKENKAQEQPKEQRQEQQPKPAGEKREGERKEDERKEGEQHNHNNNRGRNNRGRHNNNRGRNNNPSRPEQKGNKGDGQQ